MHVFFLGYPGGMGGANTECWHLVRLLREIGVEVTMIPTWAPDTAWTPRLDAIGARTVQVRRVSVDPSNPDPTLADLPTLDEVPGFAGGVAIGMCNRHVGGCVDELKRLGVRLVWMNCMTFWSEWEHRAWYEHGPPEVCVFQSHFQRAQLERRLRFFQYDLERSWVIRGAFDVDAWDFTPREPDPAEFVVGKLARPDLDKWPADLWPLLGSVPVAERRALVMGWNEGLAQKCGLPPSWAETVPPQGIRVDEFLSRCHALLCWNGGARENWPRVGLEAMAAGVPVVAPGLWGWREMIVDGVNGVLCDSHADAAFALAKLCREPRYRLGIVERAREQLWRIADPAMLGERWRECLEFAAASDVCRAKVKL